MGKNFVGDITSRISSLEKIFKEQEKRVVNWGGDNPEKKSFFSRSKQKSAEFMSLVLGKKANPLSEADIKEFNKKIFSQIFSLENPNEKNKNKKEDLYQSARWYLADTKALKDYLPEMQKQLENHWNKDKEPVITAIEEVLTKETADFIETLVDSVSNKTADKSSEQYNTSGKKFVKNVNSEIKSESKYMLREDLGDFKMQYLNSTFIVTPILTEKGLNESKGEIIIPFLEEVYKQIGDRTKAKIIAREYLKNEKAQDQFYKTFIDYNTNVYSERLFYGFWGESILGGVLQNLVSKNTNNQIEEQKVEQIGNKTSIRGIKKEDKTILLPQAPADVILTINGKEYGFQAKQWSLESFAGRNSRVDPLGTRALNYVSFSKNWQYFYNEDTWKNIIGEIEGNEKNKYNLLSQEDVKKMVDYFGSKPSNFFKHLTLGSFNFETQLPYERTIVAGNDFFYLSGRFIPSVFLLKQFLKALKNSINPLITLEMKSNKNNFNYMRATVLGLKIELDHITKQIAFNF